MHIDTLIEVFVKVIPLLSDVPESKIDDAIADKFADAVDVLLHLPAESCNLVADMVCDRLTEDEKSWFLEEIKLSSEISFIETKSKLYCGVLFAIPFVFASPDPVQEYLTDYQRWSLENLLKVNEIVSDKIKFCRLSSKLYTPDELFGLAPSDVSRLAENLANQAADFEDRIEPASSLLSPRLQEDPLEGPIQPRLMLGIAIVDEKYLEDLFPEEDLEDQADFSKELERIFNFKTENTAILGISVPNGFHSDCEKMSELFRQACFKSFLLSLLSDAPDNAEYEIYINPGRDLAFELFVADKHTKEVMGKGTWETLGHETAEGSLEELLHQIAEYSGDSLKIANDTKNSVLTKTMTLH